VETGQPPFRLVSGAAHDAMVMRALCPVAMLFIRCAGGVSHNPAERVTCEDVSLAIAAANSFLHRLASGDDWKSR
jgi:allantoate deiminase